jgi:CRISPR-associated protein Csb1
MYERLAAASSLEGEDAAIRVIATYEPGAGAGTKVSPPTYPPNRVEDPPYLLENRTAVGGETDHVVLLDSRQSQANRCEEAIQEAIDSGRVSLPHLVMDVPTHGRTIRITSLTAPHRSRDAYFRDAEDDAGIIFDKTDLGRALAEVTPADATPLFLHSPADLIYGVWDSHRGLRHAAKFPRVYTSEIVGHGAEVGTRAAGRFDLLTSGGRKVQGGNGDWSPEGKGSKKLSELGLGSIPPSTRNAKGNLVPGGVSVGTVSRNCTLSFAGLARVKVGASSEASRAARAVLAALALVGDRLAFGSPAVFLRSGCDLLVVNEAVTWVRRGGVTDPLDLDVAGAVALLEHAVGRAQDAGLVWPTQPTRLQPQAKLKKVIDEAFLSGESEDE